MKKNINRNVPGKGQWSVEDTEVNNSADPSPVIQETTTSSPEATLSSPAKKAKSQEFENEFYATNGEKCGMALVFNHNKFDDSEIKNRFEGTNKHCNDIEQVLRSLNFDVQVHSDLSYSEIKTKMHNVAIADHTKNDCIVTVVMTHDDDNKLWARDKSYHVTDLYEMFAEPKCKSLIGKPKIFFIQACRGKKIDFDVSYGSYGSTCIDMIPSTKKMTCIIPQMADLLVMFSSHANESTCFIQELCKVLRENGRNHHLLTLLMKVARNIALNYESSNDKKPISCTMSTLTKNFRFTEKN